MNGTYNFTLHATNSQGVSASDVMTLRVLGNPHDHHIIQLHLDTDISNFSRADLVCVGGWGSGVCVLTLFPRGLASLSIFVCMVSLLLSVGLCELGWWRFKPSLLSCIIIFNS